MNTDENPDFFGVNPRLKYVCTWTELIAFDPLASPASQPPIQSQHGTPHPARSDDSDPVSGLTSPPPISGCDRSSATSCNHYSTPQNPLHSAILLPSTGPA